MTTPTIRLVPEAGGGAARTAPMMLRRPRACVAAILSGLATSLPTRRRSRGLVRDDPPGGAGSGSSLECASDEGIGDAARRLQLRHRSARVRVGGSSDESAPRTPQPAPEVVLTAEEKQAWAPLPPNRSAVPVLVYHGIGPESDFSNPADASYGIDVDDFAKQLTMIEHAGYQTIDLPTFLRLRPGRAGRPPAAARSCSPSTTPERTRGPAATASSRSLASTPSCSSTSAASRTATPNT